MHAYTHIYAYTYTCATSLLVADAIQSGWNGSQLTLIPSVLVRWQCKHSGILTRLVPCQEFFFELEVLHIQASVFCEGVLVCDFGQLSCFIVKLATSGEVAPYCKA